MANNGNGSIGNVRKKLTKMHDLITTSYHEAGHAVYALLHLTRVPYVFIFENKRNKRIEGFCHYESVSELKEIKDVSLFQQQLITEIGIKYAGLTAEKYHYKTMCGSDKFPMVLRDSSSDDILSAAALFRQHSNIEPGRKRYSYKKKLVKNIQLELQDNWDVVTIVAHSLFQKKRLNYFDLKEIILKKSKNKSFWKEQFRTIDYIFDNIGVLDEKALKSILSV
jgi:ATP-dependent Zn protease